MKIEITEKRTASDTEWDDYWGKCEYATYFHSREWSEVWCEYTDGYMRKCPQIYTFTDGVQALLPLTVAGRWPLTEALLSPAGTYGGWLARPSDQVRSEHIGCLARDLQKNHGNIVWRQSPIDPLVGNLSVKGMKKDHTCLIELARDFDALFRTWSKGHRSAVKKSIREGVTVRAAECEKDWEDYYSVYLSSISRWGERVSSKYEKKLFEILYKVKSENVRLWVAEYDGVIIAGALCFYAKNHVDYWHGAAESDFFNLKPAHLLMYTVIKDCCALNKGYFDFNPSGGHDGVDAFKRSFSAERYDSHVYVASSRVCSGINKVLKIIKR